ncbi:DUF362 domain-containing protein [Clostridium sp. D2Q-11]|uniref:DUF362 domain-containing protein n=1 Tax=Anaeromonas frigoriresistens TaxID=2683708 RepID=A0A942UZB5_9FIRM|nr:DUF362 domain-containing protein [Anaeromonas frigoriresistens]MBS4537227.1 DUF362 domain-containing protein [Anaeromonas frigoriresistens]
MSTVSLIRCNNYDYLLVKSKLEQSIDNLGGLDKFISKGETVLLKINLLMKKKPEDATTTHPIFTKALASILLEYGAKVIIGDSPAGPFSVKSLKGIYKICGIEDIVNELDHQNVILNYNIAEEKVYNTNGEVLKNLVVADMVNKVDKVISVSKLKTHGMCTFTGAVKNMFGIVPGVLKAEYHFKMPNINDFADALIDICEYANPVLSFMDGIVGMEGAGPSAGTPRNLDVILASDSPYHLDLVATSIINLKPKEVPTIQRSIERNIMSGLLDDISLVGEPIEKFKLKDFSVPKTRSVHFIDDNWPEFLRKFADKALKPKPVFNHNICIGCEDCKNSCPPKVIDMVNRKPIVNLEGCIRCFCCQELCPVKAVDIKRPILMKILTKL